MPGSLRVARWCVQCRHLCANCRPYPGRQHLWCSIWARVARVWVSATATVASATTAGQRVTKRTSRTRETTPEVTKRNRHSSIAEDPFTVDQVAFPRHYTVHERIARCSDVGYERTALEPHVVFAIISTRSRLFQSKPNPTSQR